MNDHQFDEFLRTAKNECPLPSSFRQGVWSRIESAPAECGVGGAKWKRLFNVFSQPWGAAAGLAATILLGLWLGAVSAPTPVNAERAYVQSVSPFPLSK
jgi:hypothetical protein